MVFENLHFHGCQIATSNSVKQYKLRKLIACLSEKRALSKDFVSLYIPKGAPLDEIVANLKKTPDNDAKDSLPNVLKNIIQYLKQLKEIPENGLAIFAGIYGYPQDSESEYELEEVIPAEPIAAYLFNVDDHFHLEPLRDMLRNQKTVGLIAIDSKEASFGLLNGELLEIIETITSGIHGKSGKGGSSQRRYERERDMAITGYFHRAADHAAKAFLENHTITALVIGGPGTTKADFSKGDYLNYELQNALLSIVDTQSAGKEAIKEILDKSTEERQNMCAPEERNIMQRLLASIGKQDGLAIYGLDPVLTALKSGEAEVALVTDSTDMLETVATCKSCGLSKTKIVDEAGKVAAIQEQISAPCERCRAVEYDVSERDIIDILEDAASQTNARVEVISSESPEKDKLTALSGFAALLRYKHS